MRCPICDWTNYVGDDQCANCGADLASEDAPESVPSLSGRLLRARVDELDAPPPATIRMDATVREAVERMQREGRDCLLVLEGDALVGIFTDRDAVLKVAGGPIDAQSLRAVMTKDPVVLRPDDSIAVAIHKMAVGGFRHVPVVDDGRPTGLVSARDVFRFVAQRLS